MLGRLVRLDTSGRGPWFHLVVAIVFIFNGIVYGLLLENHLALRLIGGIGWTVGGLIYLADAVSGFRERRRLNP